MRAHILIVEDEALLYERLRRVLVKERFSVGSYAPSVTEALRCIEEKRPDIALLDIDLQGDKSGLDLGRTLYHDYGIPFIYVTQHDDNQTFYKGLDTQHEQFIVKTKPRLDTREVVRAIETTIHKTRKNMNSVKASKPINPFSKTGIMGLTNYLDILKEGGVHTLARIPIPYADIAYFTVRPKVNTEGKLEKVRTNYLWFKTVSRERYYMKYSLRQLQQHLPQQFERINESYIVNLQPHILDGRINGSQLSVLNEILVVSDTYKEAVKQKMETLYL